MTTTNFFKPTKEELLSADKTRPVFIANENVVFMISEVKETVDKDGKDRLIIGTVVQSGTHKGKEYAFFINDNPTSRGIVINMMKCFWTDEEMLGGRAGGVGFLGKTLSSECKESSKMVNGAAVVYQNFYQFKEVSSAPTIGGGLPSVPTTDSNIPF